MALLTIQSFKHIIMIRDDVGLDSMIILTIDKFYHSNIHNKHQLHHFLH